MPRVLVVDDEKDIRSSLRGILTDEGLEVLEAENGRRAVELARKERPDVVLLDVWMPDGDGLEILRELRKEFPPPEVIMISGHGTIETAVRATQWGACDFVEKPFSLEGLLRAVSSALRRREENPEAEPSSAHGLPLPRPVRTPGGTVPQRTIRRSVVATGHGLHSGQKTGLLLRPLPPDSGIVFTNLSGDAFLPLDFRYAESTGYATSLYGCGLRVRTVEHLLAVFHAYGITNCLVKVEKEVPVFDGSAAPLCELVESAGIEEQDAKVEELVLERAVELEFASDPPKKIVATPAPTFSLEYELAYPPPIGRQVYRYEHEGPEAFRRELAPARTFGLLDDIKALTALGMAHGGRLDNCVLVGEQGVLNTPLRFPDEFARHKVLDLMGDLYLLGRPLRASVRAQCTGHRENLAFLRALGCARDPGPVSSSA
ncbi:MAG: hypothetical protein KatS3mg076_0737 [Candidatus Binatia bacterium]|nr:MAG: hypothetical protein KatS3mg076_0737 [Candidatus Binatia bacterium]